MARALNLGPIAQQLLDEGLAFKAHGKSVCVQEHWKNDSRGIGRAIWVSDKAITSLVMKRAESKNGKPYVQAKREHLVRFPVKREGWGPVAYFIVHHKKAMYPTSLSYGLSWAINADALALSGDWLGEHVWLMRWLELHGLKSPFPMLGEEVLKVGFQGMGLNEYNLLPIDWAAPSLKELAAFRFGNKKATKPVVKALGAYAMNDRPGGYNTARALASRLEPDHIAQLLRMHGNDWGDLRNIRDAWDLVTNTPANKIRSMENERIHYNDLLRVLHYELVMETRNDEGWITRNRRAALKRIREQTLGGRTFRSFREAHDALVEAQNTRRRAFMEVRQQHGAVWEAPLVELPEDHPAVEVGIRLEAAIPGFTYARSSKDLQAWGDALHNCMTNYRHVFAKPLSHHTDFDIVAVLKDKKDKPTHGIQLSFEKDPTVVTVAQFVGPCNALTCVEAYKAFRAQLEGLGYLVEEYFVPHEEGEEDLLLDAI